MALGKRRTERQDELWVAAGEVVAAPGHPFYRKLNAVLTEAGFDRWVERRCERFYAKFGRPGIPPGIYFRMLMIGYFEGLDSERGIAWRCADSLGLREFLGCGITESTPDHSTLSVIRQRLDVETHEEVFGWILERVHEAGLIKGKTIGVDATTLEANAALRSLVRNDTGEKYHEFLESLAKASGIETPTREDLARLDRQRKGKGSNKDWHNPHDPDAKITKMKDGRTHLAHKAEHAVDMETGAVLSVTLQPANRGDTDSIGETLMDVAANLDELGLEAEELVADKGYHSKARVDALRDAGLRTYIAEPKHKVRRWPGQKKQRDAVYANRRRIKGDRGKRLLRRRGEMVERPFAHCYETGGMRRTHLRGHDNIRKRLLIHVGACNLGLLMRSLCGAGTPKGLAALAAALCALIEALRTPCRPPSALLKPIEGFDLLSRRPPARSAA